MDRSMNALSQSLNFRQLRNDLISSNIANADTPGYKAKEINFEDSLARSINTDGQQKLNTFSENHYDVGEGGLDNLELEVTESTNNHESLDGNNVNRDEEFANLAENRILYDASIQLMNKKLGLIKYAISSDR